MKLYKSTHDPIMVELIHGKVVRSNLYRLIRDHVIARLPILPLKIALPLKEICGRKFWAQLSDIDRRTAGAYFLHMVTHREVSMIEVRQKHEYPKKYRRV